MPGCSSRCGGWGWRDSTHPRAEFRIVTPLETSWQSFCSVMQLYCRSTTHTKASVNPIGNRPWIFIGRTDAEAAAPILWPPDVKELTHWKISWYWEVLRTGGEAGDRRWDGWMASLTQCLSKLTDILKYRKALCAAVHGVATSRTWLSDWKTTMASVCRIWTVTFQNCCLERQGLWRPCRGGIDTSHPGRSRSTGPCASPSWLISGPWLVASLCFWPWAGFPQGAWLPSTSSRSWWVCRNPWTWEETENPL